MEERLREILGIALEFEVTDIHFSLSEKENGKEEMAVEMRVHGEMRQLRPHPDDLKLFRFLMYRSNLDLSTAFQPQTGAFEAQISGKRLSLRFAVVAGYHRSSGVLRILNNHALLSVSDLTCDPSDAGWLAGIPDLPPGLVIFSGPTGSGKTTSLYTILDAAEGKKIYTLEDPVEIVHERYIQLQVNERQHMSYAEGIRQLMRHDPDLIMIGEIRDGEAAMMAVRCALTGHLVITSLHAQDCVSAIFRMMDLGVQDYQLRDVLCGISCQRLFETDEGKKTGVYEIMDRKEVEFWFEHRHVSEHFIPLSEKIKKAQRAGIIASFPAEQKGSAGK